MEENKELRSLHSVPGRLKGLQSTARPVQSRKSACCRLRISFDLVLFLSQPPSVYISSTFNPFHSLLTLSYPSQLRLKCLKVASASAQLQDFIVLSPFSSLSSSDTWSAPFHTVTLKCSPVTLLHLLCMSVAGKRSPIQLLMHKVMDNKLFVINCDSMRQQKRKHPSSFRFFHVWQMSCNVMHDHSEAAPTQAGQCGRGRPAAVLQMFSVCLW